MTDLLCDLNFKALFDAVVDGMLLIDGTGQIMAANPAAQKLFEYSEDELSGLTVEMLMPSRYRKKHQDYRAAFFSKPVKRIIGDGKEFVALTRNGRELKLDIGLSPIKVQEKSYILATLNVAYQRLQVEEALRVSEERLRLAKQAANLGIYDCDCKQQLIYLDEKMRELWGSSSESMTYEDFIATIHPEDRAARQAAFNCAIDAGSHGGFYAEYRIINPINGIESWIASAGQVYFGDGRAPRLIGVVRDVTEQKNFQKKLQAQRDEAEILFKQQVAARTASAIAHELNQPLTAISAYSEVALHALHNDQFNADNLRKALKGCVKQAQRAGRSLHELLAFLQKGDIKTEQLNLVDLIKESVDMARNGGYGGFFPVLRLEKNLPDIQGNRVQIQKVLANLFRNAVEAMLVTDTPNSKITILVRSLTKKNMAMVVVQDSGLGLDKLTEKRIFDPFFSTKANGIGMGLAISRALIEANGGQLWVDLSARPGAKFNFTLPFSS